ncbi:MAG: FtsQ-type POTRA domain-containing protein [Firmicutes bacterium]|nr:FtsQ-type POTRA domain-containing protein [Bacillota bacterium]
MPAKKKVRLAFLLLLLLLFCWQLVQAPWFLAVREVEVRNISTLSPWEVEQIAGIYRGTSLLKIDTREVQRRLEADERILQAEVKRHWPHRIIITIQENVGFAAVPYFNDWLEVNQEGRILSVTKHFSALNLPIVTGLDMSVVKVGDSLSDHTRWQVATECLNQLPASLLGQISEINVSDPSNIVLYSRDPLRIMIGDSNNLAKKFGALTGMLDRVREAHKEELANGQLDVSSGRAVFIKGP